MPVSLGLDDTRPPGGDPGYQLDVGRVISSTFSVTFANLGPFCLLGFLVHVPAFLLYGLAAVLPLDDTAARAVTLLGSLVGGLMSLVLAGALTYGVIEHLRGRRAGIGDILRVGLGSVGRVFVVSLLTGIAVFIGCVLCIVPGVIVICMLWVSVPVAVIEQPGIMASLERSQEATSGTRLGVFAVVLVMGLIGAVISMVVFGGATVVAVVSSGGALTAQGNAAVQLVLSVLLIPVQCLGASTAAVGYHDLRVHREGVDVQDLVKVFE